MAMLREYVTAQRTRKVLPARDARQLHRRGREPEFDDGSAGLPWWEGPEAPPPPQKGARRAAAPPRPDGLRTRARAGVACARYTPPPHTRRGGGRGREHTRAKPRNGRHEDAPCSAEAEDDRSPPGSNRGLNLKSSPLDHFSGKRPSKNRMYVEYLQYKAMLLGVRFHLGWNPQPPLSHPSRRAASFRALHTHTRFGSGEGTNRRHGRARVRPSLAAAAPRSASSRAGSALASRRAGGRVALAPRRKSRRTTPRGRARSAARWPAPRGERATRAAFAARARERAAFRAALGATVWATWSTSRASSTDAARRRRAHRADVVVARALVRRRLRGRGALQRRAARGRARARALRAFARRFARARATRAPRAPTPPTPTPPTPPTPDADDDDDDDDAMPTIGMMPTLAGSAGPEPHVAAGDALWVPLAPARAAALAGVARGVAIRGRAARR